MEKPLSVEVSNKLNASRVDEKNIKSKGKFKSRLVLKDANTGLSVRIAGVAATILNKPILWLGRNLNFSIQVEVDQKKYNLNINSIAKRLGMNREELINKLKDKNAVEKWDYINNLALETFKKAENENLFVDKDSLSEGLFSAIPENYPGLQKTESIGEKICEGNFNTINMIGNHEVLRKKKSGNEKSIKLNYEARKNLNKISPVFFPPPPKIVKVCRSKEEVIGLLEPYYSDGSAEKMYVDQNYHKCADTTEKRFEIVRTLIGQLKTMHEHDYTHLDIKPENILIGLEGESPVVFITDMDGVTHTLEERYNLTVSFTENYTDPFLSSMLLKLLLQNRNDPFPAK